jgi:putative oxidoreductase
MRFTARAMGRLLAPTPISLDLGLLVLRLTAGLSLALAHGWSKVRDIGGFEQGLAQMGFTPASAWAWAAALSEFLGGLLVAVGLLTRPAALAAGAVMGVALAKVHAADPYAKQEPALIFLAMFLAIFLCGPGRMSLDQAFFGRSRSRSSSSSK